MDDVKHDNHDKMFAGLAKTYTKEVENIHRAIAKCTAQTSAIDTTPKAPATVQSKGEQIQSFYDTYMRLAHTAELEKIKYEDLLANLFITAVSDHEIKGELMKLKNPTCEDIRDEIDRIVMWREDMGTTNNVTYDKPARALAADSTGNRNTKCYTCAGDHLAANCTADKSKLKSTKCSKVGLSLIHI